MNATRFRTHRRIPALAVLALLALAAAWVFWPAPAVHGQDQETAPTVNFDGLIPAQTWTGGTDVNAKVTPTSDPDGQGFPRLPEATFTNAPANTVGWDVAYTATDLPAGLTMGQDRIIRGTPESVTEVALGSATYTATVSVYVDPNNDQDYSDLTESTYTASRTITYLIQPAVTFNKEAKAFFNSRIIAWKSGSGWLADTNTRVNDAGISVPAYVSSITFPAATGGTGLVTYRLVDNSSGSALSSVASGINFDTNTRTLSGTPAPASQKTWAVTYVAEDQNGSTAVGYLTIYAGGYGGL